MAQERRRRSLGLASPCILGIDLGTTSVKVVLVEETDKGPSLVASCTKPVRADVHVGDAPLRASEQDVSRIIEALNGCLATFSPALAQRVCGVGISGQMHGVMFWEAGKGCSWSESGGRWIFQPDNVSRLITWQDGRCSPKFLSSLPRPRSHLSVASGYGCATIFWLLKNRPDFLASYTAAGTIQDYVVAMLCGREKPQMSVQNAAAWGYFSTVEKSWNTELLRDSGFPVHLLPEVIDSGDLAGETSQAWHQIPAGTEVGVALGDFQCSVYSCVSENGDAGHEASESDLYRPMIQAGLAHAETRLRVCPTVFGERHAPLGLASVTDIATSETSLGQVVRALCRGVVGNLRSMLPAESLEEAGAKRIVASGSGLCRNEVMKQEVGKAFALPVAYGKVADAALGAAYVTLKRNNGVTPLEGTPGVF